MTAQSERARDEARIRALVSDWADALRAKDANRVMAHHAPGSVTFDLAPPLISNAANAQGLDAWLSTWRGPLDYEIRDLNVTAGDAVAFCHTLNRLSGTKTDGAKADVWFRQTLCLRRVGG